MKHISKLTLALAPVLTLSTALSAKTTPSFDAQEYFQGELIVKYKDGTSEIQKQAARSLIDTATSNIGFDNIANGNIEVVKFSKDLSIEEAIAQLKNNKDIEFVEPNQIFKLSQRTPNDAQFGNLWGLDNNGQEGGVADADIDAPEAWDITVGSRDVVVGIIDSGIDYNHVDLVDNIWSNPGEIPGNGIDDDGNGKVDDVRGWSMTRNSGNNMDTNAHGTHVAGTIGATGNNETGVTGVNWNVSMVACQMFGPTENGGVGSGSLAAAVGCVNYMVGLKRAGVNLRVINNSWGGGGFSQALEDAINEAAEEDILFVVAAGNDGRDADTFDNYPGDYAADNIFSVVSTTRTDSMSGFSNYGLTATHIGAPGSAIVSTVPNNGYASFDGTSMAAPHVTGAAGLVFSLRPDISVAQLKELLMTTGDALPALEGKTISGRRLNVANAVREVANPSFYIGTESPTSLQLVQGDTATYEFTMAAILDWEGTATLSASSDSDLALELSATEANPGDTFSLSVATTEETPYGQYTFTLTATSGDIVRTQNVMLDLLPAGLVTGNFSNSTVIEIPDNDPAGISSTIVVGDALEIFNVEVGVDITHTYSGDLVLSLVSPAGTEHVLRARQGGGVDDIVETYTTEVFNGELSNGEWTLKVVDTFAADLGQLNSWSLAITGLGELNPAAPVANFSFEAEELVVQFTDLSVDQDNNIETWAWDFGDGTTSSEASPLHTFPATGTYEVSLTVTDADGFTSTYSESIFVEAVVRVYELEMRRFHTSLFGSLMAGLKWTGKATEEVDLFVNEEKFATISNRGRFNYYVSSRSRNFDITSYTFYICEPGTLNCSNEITVSTTGE